MGSQFGADSHKGLSERLLISHYENNYGGALRRLNAIRATLGAMDWSTAPVFEVNGRKREELIAAGSVILHEIYFDALGGEGGDPPPGLDLAEARKAISGALQPGALSSLHWQKPRRAAPAGSSWPGSAGW